MYSDEDLTLAVEKGIFTASSVNEFRQSISTINHSPSVDEENFKLIGGFNDIFVVIACGLLLFSSVFVLQDISESLGFAVLTLLSWALAEFFVLKRKMSLPAILLLIAFVGGVFSFALSFFTDVTEISIVVAAAASTVAAYIHWLRFKVPITVAAGTVAAIGLIVSLVLSVFPDTQNWIFYLVFICGITAFLLAMHWDSADTQRVTGKSDVAFWLHLASAPLIIHPIFYGLGVFDGNESLWVMALVILLYIVMSVISITIDRRAFMVSSLAYVIYALKTIMDTYGDVSYSFALTGVVMGATLLLLSAFWQTTRNSIVKALPTTIQRYIPSTNST